MCRLRCRRLSSSRSALVKPPSPLPASRAACLTHKPIVQAVGPNSFASDVADRPERCSSTIWRLNSAVYRVVVFAIVNPSKSNVEVSTKAGQLQKTTFRPFANVAAILSSDNVVFPAPVGSTRTAERPTSKKPVAIAAR